MFTTEPLITFYQKWEEALSWTEQRLSRAGFIPLRTFDLKTARAGQAACSCPHHGTEQCDCQMLVLLVYGPNSQPLSLVVHGHGEITWIYAVNTPQQRADARLLSLIAQELTPLDPPPPQGQPIAPDPRDFPVNTGDVQAAKDDSA